MTWDLNNSKKIILSEINYYMKIMKFLGDTAPTVMYIYEQF